MLVLRTSYSQKCSHSQHDELMNSSIWFQIHHISLQLFDISETRPYNLRCPVAFGCFWPWRDWTTPKSQNNKTFSTEFLLRENLPEIFTILQLLPASFFSQVSLTLWCVSFLHYVHSSSVFVLLFNNLHLLFHPLFKTYHQTTHRPSYCCRFKRKKKALWLL